MIDCIIVEGGTHAKVIIDIIQCSRDYNIIGYSDKNDQHLEGVPYLGPDAEIMKKIGVAEVECVNGIGGVRDTRKREEVYKHFTEKGYRFATIIHDSAIVSKKADIMRGALIMAGVIINAGSLIGENVLINSNSLIDHDCKIEAHTAIAPGCTLCGGLHIKEGSFIGAGTTIIQNVTIGRQCTVGAGSLVLKSIPDGETVYGVPVRL